MAWDIANTKCHDDCRDYHRVRPLLRALGLSAQPSDQQRFFDEALACGGIDVLVCGASDSAMPSLVHAALNRSGHSTRLRILDRCQTPLDLSRRIFNSSASGISTSAADILNWKTAARYDVITTHSLLGQFAPRLRSALFSKWFSLLRPGGRIVTVNRMRPDCSSASFAVDAIEQLANEVSARCRNVGAFKDVDGDEIRSAVQVYARKRHTNPVRSVEEIIDLCCVAGLRVLSADERYPETLLPNIAGPAIPADAPYVHLIAQRPA